MKKVRILTVILISAMALVTLFAAACTTDKKNVKFYASGCDHEWVNDEDFYTAPTCTESGCLVYVCTVCGESDERTISAFGHSGVYSGETTIMGDDGEETAAFFYECSKCGQTKTETYDDVAKKNGDLRTRIRLL